MTELDQRHARTASRLDLLHALSEDLSNTEVDALRAYFLGALSAEVDEQIWDDCLGSALQLVESDRARRAHPSARPERD